MSSEIDSDSDESHKTVSIDFEWKAETRLIVSRCLTCIQMMMMVARIDSKFKSMKATTPGKKQELKPMAKIEPKVKLKTQLKKVVKQSPKHKDSEDEDETDKESNDKKLLARKKAKSLTQKKSASALKKTNNGSIKRKKTKDDDRNSDKNVVTKKRMASLNASAILAANYEIENYAAKHESSSTETSDSSSDNDEDDGKNDFEPPTMKKEKRDVKMESEEVFLLLSNLFHLLFVLLAQVTGLDSFILRSAIEKSSSW